MRSLRPEQILLLLIIVLVPLLNVLVRWLRRREQQHPLPVEPGAAAAAERAERPPVPLPPRARVLESARPRQSFRKTPQAPLPRPVIRRAKPLGGRAAVRRAVVVMTILAPCRALEERTPIAPVRPSPRTPRP